MGVMEKVFRDDQLIERLTLKFLELQGYCFCGTRVLDSSNPRVMIAKEMAIAALEIVKEIKE
jgi:hypothetical protein